MNVIFLDFDGVIDTVNLTSKEEIEKKIQILSEIVHEFNCKIVIEAACKSAIDEYTLEYDSEWLDFVFKLFKKYDIECIGRTPEVGKHHYLNSGLSMWKEDEILLYLCFHPEIEHFCIIDDDDYYEYTKKRISDLEKVKDYLVKTIYSSFDNPSEEGLLLKHKELIGEILKKENIFKNYIIEHKDELSIDFKRSFFYKIERDLYEKISNQEDLKNVKNDLNYAEKKLEEYYNLIEAGLIDEVYEKEFVKKKGKI